MIIPARLRLTAKRTVIRYRIEKWVWIGVTGLVLLLYEVDPHLWAKISILYLALVSNYALVLTAGGAEQAAEAVVQATDEPETGIAEKDGETCSLE